MSVVQVIIDRSATETIQGVKTFDRANGGVLVAPSGTSYPASPVAGEWFWKTDEQRLYRRNLANNAWETVYASPGLHANTHKHGGTDEVATTVPIAGGVPEADGNGKIDTGWLKVGNTLGTVCAGDDGRLSDSRTPTAHKTSHEPGGSDALTVDAAAVTGSLRTLGTASTSACAGDDARLSNARTPTAHATTHQSGGSDAIKLDDLAAPEDNTDLNVSTSAHGLTPKLPNDSTKYLDGTGSWQTDVFGRNYQAESSEAESTTTSTQWQDKVTLTTPALPAGTYRVNFTFEIATGTASTYFQGRLYNDTDAVELNYHKDSNGANNYIVVSGYANVTFAGVAKTFKIQFARVSGSNTVYIRRARISIWRVA